LNRTFDEGVDVSVIVNQLTNNISGHISEKPQLIPLLDALIDVIKSPQPQLKLISVLGMSATAKQTPKTAALLASTHQFSASIEELEKKATEDKPSNDIEKVVGVTSIQDTLESKLNKAPGLLDNPARSSALDGSATATNLPHESNKKGSQKTEITRNDKFEWSKLLDYTRKNHIALYSILSNCGYKIDNNNLTIYANNKFYKKKLDDTKYSVLLSKCLQKIGAFELDIHTIPTPLPPTNSQAAAVAVIMGGGEEVSLESI
jgi:hypothetical protein